MIRSIHIRGEASFGTDGESLTDLEKQNFVYGSNGSGKTTISRVIADEAAFEGCSVVWRGGTPLEALVYNRDFVEKNFDQSPELHGIFTLGEEDKDTLTKIATAKSELDTLAKDIISLTDALEGEDGRGGKKGELFELESEFEDSCWDLKLKHDDKLQGAFAGVRGKKKDFKARFISESNQNKAALATLQHLEDRAETVYGETPETEALIVVPVYDDLLLQEADPILEKKIIGKADVDIAAMIGKLGNSDWVKEGRVFYEANGGLCPFCQKSPDESFAASLNEYFDEAFEEDMASLRSFYQSYRTNSERVQRAVQTLSEPASRFLDSEKLDAEKEILDSKIRLNLQRIEKKGKESSQRIDLDSLSEVLGAVRSLVEDANKSIEKHNLTAANLAREKCDLTAQVWKFLLEDEGKSVLARYVAKKDGLTKAIESMTGKIELKGEEKRSKETLIQGLERNTTSIQPTVGGINTLLGSFGFTGFKLERSTQDRFYKIVRSDGSDAKETLSEGEKTFITFLYFYHLLKGSGSESGVTNDRVVVFDDPVSSLDSDILFIVSSLIRGLFQEVRSGDGNIKQIFVLTHNVYFHKEVTFDPDRGAGTRGDETFWTVRKSNQLSKLRRHDQNPIKTSYELLWGEVRDSDRSNPSIQNTLRRILDSYFKIMGNAWTPDEVCAKFSGREQLICRSLYSWINDGSHYVNDDLYIATDDAMVEGYLAVFKSIFDKTGHRAHYDMMMGKSPGGSEVLSG